MTRQQQPKKHSDDDGRTIADMSFLDGPAPEPLEPGPHRDIREELGDPADRWTTIFGAMGAGVLLWAVYVVIFAIVIAILLLIWN